MSSLMKTDESYSLELHKAILRTTNVCSESQIVLKHKETFLASQDVQDERKALQRPLPLTRYVTCSGWTALCPGGWTEESTCGVA